MILEKQTENLVLEEGESQKTYATEIDMDSIQFLKQMLSKFYADPIGSLIRETASNALDSHREAGVKDPIVVTFKQNAKDGNWEFSVEDFGIGANEETIENIFRKYGKSTKRKSENLLGAYGLGLKSPIAYTSSFYMICRKAGVETKVMMYESEDDVSIDILYTGATHERNGVKVIVPVKYSDRYAFEKKIKEQLAYFEDVFFNCPGISNDFKIFRHDLFQHSTLCENNDLHLCLDNVYYPLDFNKLGISRIDEKIALRFKLTDGIFPVPNRESIKYTKESIEIIKKRIADLSEYFVLKYNETIKNTDDIFGIFNYFNSSNRDLKGLIDNHTISADIFEKYAKSKIQSPKLNNVRLLDLKRIHQVKQYLLKPYSVEYDLYNGRFSERKRGNELYFSYLEENDKVYLFSDKIVGNKKAWLREETSGYGRKYFVKKLEELSLKGKLGSYNYDNWTSILELKNYPKSQWRQRIKEALYIRDLMTKRFVDLDKINVPEAWLKAREDVKKLTKVKKAKDKANKNLGEISGKIATSLERYVSGKNSKFVPGIFNMKEASKQKYFVVYGSDAESEKMDKYFQVFNKNVKFVVFSQRELKNLKTIKLHNWMSMEEFEKGDHILFRRIVTAYLINKLIVENVYVFSKVQYVEKLSSDLSDKILLLNSYKQANFRNASVDIYEAMLQVAETRKLYDYTIYDTYLKVKEVVKKFKFMNVILASIRTYGAEEIGMIQVLKDLCKYHKMKMNWKNYVPVLNEEKELVED